MADYTITTTESTTIVTAQAETPYAITPENSTVSDSTRSTVDDSQFTDKLDGLADNKLQTILEAIDQFDFSVGVNPISITFDSSGDKDEEDPYSLEWTGTVLRTVHAYGIDYIPTLTIMDADGVRFYPPVVTWIDSNTIDIDFGITITGEWTMMLSTGGIGQKGDTGEAGETGDTGEAGTNGTDGDSAYVYIAYASDGSGTGFTTTFNSALEYIAILSTDTEIPSPAVGDFSGLWCKYKGSDGADGVDGEDGEDGEDGVGSLTTYADLATMEASTAEVDTNMVWCTALATLYQRIDDGSAYTRDGTFICNTGSGGDTRFIAKAGAYTYAEANFTSVIISLSTPEDLTDATLTLTSAYYGLPNGKPVDCNRATDQTITIDTLTSAHNGYSLGGGITKLGDGDVTIVLPGGGVTWGDGSSGSITITTPGEPFKMRYNHSTLKIIIDYTGAFTPGA